MTPFAIPARWLSPEATVREAEQALLDSPENFLCLGEAATGELLGVLTLHDLRRGIQEADAER